MFGVYVRLMFRVLGLSYETNFRYYDCVTLYVKVFTIFIRNFLTDLFRARFFSGLRRQMQLPRDIADKEKESTLVHRTKRLKTPAKLREYSVAE